MKYCGGCLTIKSINNFYNNRSCKDGKCAHCKICHDKIRISRRSKQIEAGVKYKATAKGRFKKLKESAKSRKHTVNFTFEEYQQIWSNECHYCGNPLSLTGGGLDRKDNSLNYTIENVVCCCPICNRIKGEHISYNEMIQIAKLLKELRSV